MSWFVLFCFSVSQVPSDWTFNGPIGTVCIAGDDRVWWTQGCRRCLLFLCFSFHITCSLRIKDGVLSRAFAFRNQDWHKTYKTHRNIMKHQNHPTFWFVVLQKVYPGAKMCKDGPPCVAKSMFEGSRQSRWSSFTSLTLLHVTWLLDNQSTSSESVAFIEVPRQQKT